MKATFGVLQFKFQERRATNQVVELSKPTRVIVRKFGFSENCLTGWWSCLIQDSSRDCHVAHGEEETSMMTSRTYKEHVAKWQPSAAMRGVCLSAGLSSASVTLGVNTFSGRLGQATSIDSRYIRQ